ncbi:MAG: hypothetical protein JRJ19_15230 [Deltaproteobacteria bacterium]|nr:hypothetical protein [Deltaproteobacteria bacterium]MBW1873420.1 hypothetical protein [Deltaproteobacteria bacterium]
MRRFFIVLMIGLFVVPALAQEGGEGSASAGFEQAAELSDSEKLDRATGYLGEMKGVLGHVLRLLKDAREEKDVIKVNCVNEKLTNIKGLIRISEQAEMTLQEALAKGEKDTATHEFHKISISHQKIKILRTEAEQCVGELAFAVGKTTVEVEIDKDQVPEDDPTNVELPETNIIRPPAASPYQ